MNQNQSIARTQDRPITRARRGAGLVIASFLMLILLLFAVGDVQSFRVVSRSMDPTLKVGDHVLMVRDYTEGKLSKRVVAFEPDDGGTPLTKRVVADEGQRVDLRAGRLFVDQKQDYHSRDRLQIRGTRSWEVGSNEVFVAGDNRNNSYDSVDHGPIPRSRILGVVTLRYWPLERVGAIN